MKSLKTILSVVCFLLMSVNALRAQAPPPPSDPTSGGNQSPSGGTGAPIDGGLSVLLSLAGAYAIRNLRTKNRR